MTNTPPTADREGNGLPRRAVLGTGAGLAAGLAGCGGQGPEETDEMVTANLVHTAAFNPNQFNAAGWYNQSGFGRGFYAKWRPFLWSVLQSRTYHPEEPFNVVIDEINPSDDGCTNEITLIDGLQWWDGTTLTPESIVMHDRIRKYQTYGPDIEGKGDTRIEQVDDRTVRADYDSPKNSYIVTYRTGVPGFLFTKPSFYRSYYERFQDATTQEAVDAVTRELTEDVNIPMEQFVEDGLGSGPWKPADWTQTSMTLEKVEEHPLADDIPIDRLNIDMVADRTKRNERYRRGDFDAVHFNDAGDVNLEQNDMLSNVHTFPFNATINVHFKFFNKHLRRRRVRRAIAYILDFTRAKQLLEDNGIPAKPDAHQVDVPAVTKEAYLSEDFLDRVIKYGLDAKKAKARSEMEAAGYSKEGGTWVGPGGDAIENLDFTCFSLPKIDVCAQYVNSALNEFGIGNELSFTGYNTWSRDFRQKEGGGPDMTIHWGGTGDGIGYAINQWVGMSRDSIGSSSSPFGAALPEDWSPPSPEGCQRTEPEAPPLTADRDPLANHPVRPEYPVEVGRKDLDGDTQTLYPIKWKLIADQSPDMETISDISEKLAWYVNWQLPRVTIYSETIKISGNTRDFEWETDSPIGFSQRSTIQVGLGGVSPR